ncbi:MAG: transcriptional repressor [Candidatus Bipolaricaulota bacterium]
MTTDRRAMQSSLAAAGKRLTPERELLLDVIGQHPHSDAIEILRLARKRRPRIGLATVYRTLRLLEELEVVEARRLGQPHSHYEVRRRDHLHLVCTRCGAVLDLPSPFDVTALEREHDFEVSQVRLELVGLCAKCRRAARREAETS